MKIMIIETTFTKRGEADEVLRRLIEEKLAACAHVTRISSSYMWQGVERSVDEHHVSLKTSVKKADAMIARLKDLHSYEVPMIVAHEVESSDEYAKWVTQNTT